MVHGRSSSWTWQYLWKHIIVEGIPVINVGVDARNYMPISKAEVAAVYYRIIKGNKK